MENAKDINIVLSADNQYSPYLCTALLSVLASSKKDESLNFYVLDGGISAENKSKIRNLQNYKHFKIEFVKIDNKSFENCPITKNYFTLPTYYRIKIPSLLKNLDKVIYLDSDILVLKSLGEFFSMDLGKKLAGVVQDISYMREYLNSDNSHLKTLGVSKYFNAGILLLNLKEMRKQNIEQKCFDFIKNHPHKIKWVDQCVLNAVFKENTEFLDLKYNFQYNPYFDKMHSIYKQKKNDIAVIHFLTDKKPWVKNYNHKLRNLYFKYLFKTPYKQEFVTSFFDKARGFSGKVLMFLKLLLWQTLH